MEKIQNPETWPRRLEMETKTLEETRLEVIWIILWPKVYLQPPNIHVCDGELKSN